MTENGGNAAGRPSRREISEAVGDLGWRYVLGALQTQLRVPSLRRAADVAARVVAAAGAEADGALWMDVRGDRLVLTLQSLAAATVTSAEVELAGRISAAVRELGLRLSPGVADPEPRSVQLVEIAIDALDAARIRPFWKAVMGYVDEVGADGPQDPIVDPLRHGPAIWFQRMDEARPQRNRIHLDVSVPHDEAPRRIEAALAAGGVLLSDGHAPSFWVLADAEGNEVCVTTWQGRD
ncbi:VOC family protein [Planomonospora sp. ID82291]|uniref:VOC family protein n=1 Tax=Planomonospora sp. ID82291 TaxID=2738136 RepID=UPI0018C4301A|nr:VOC family protein [Planomonospora sp. ID82291]MBG0814051.1 VOC family protein [Planomonospora sp. ID82291]